jgi:hypothetical protein
LTKKRQVQVYWVVVAGMLIFLLGSTFVKSNVIQGLGLLVVIGSFVYLWRNRRALPPETKKQ